MTTSLRSSPLRLVARVALFVLFLWLTGRPAHVAGGAAQLFLPIITRPETFRIEQLGAFDTATAITTLPDGRLLVGERAGRVWSVSPTGQKTSFLNLTGRVVDDHPEQGLLEIIADPGFATNGYFYVMYTGKDEGPNHTLVSRFHAAPGGGSQSNTELILLSISQTSQVHHGGGLAFGPADGLLYAGIGDGRNGELAQRPDSVRGKIIRLAVAQAPATETAPPLHAWRDARKRVDADIFALGLRNPWRIAFDAPTGDLFITDVGEKAWEEINLSPAGAGGRNYGWPCREGPDVYSSDGPCAGSAFAGPIYVYGHDSGRCAIIGGPVRRTAGGPRLVFGDFCSGEMLELRPAGAAWVAGDLALTPGYALTTFGAGGEGVVYAGLAGETAPLLRLVFGP